MRAPLFRCLSIPWTLTLALIRPERLAAAGIASRPMITWDELRRRRGIALGVTGLAVMALAAPLRPSESPEASSGLLLVGAAVL